MQELCYFCLCFCRCFHTMLRIPKSFSIVTPGALQTRLLTSFSEANSELLSTHLVSPQGQKQKPGITLCSPVLITREYSLRCKPFLNPGCKNFHLRTPHAVNCFTLSFCEHHFTYWDEINKCGRKNLFL